jgi:hypothetical protein
MEDALQGPQVEEDALQGPQVEEDALQGPQVEEDAIADWTTEGQTVHPDEDEIRDGVQLRHRIRCLMYYK